MPYIGSSRYKYSPYLTIHFNRTERFLAGDAPSPWEPPETPTVSYTSTCSWIASTLILAMDNLPLVDSGDGNPKYLGIYYSSGNAAETATLTPSYLIDTGNIGRFIIDLAPCVRLSSARIEFGDQCYATNHPNYRFNFRNTDFTVKIDVYFNQTPLADPFYGPARSIFAVGPYASGKVYRAANKTLGATLLLGDDFLDISTDFTLSTSQWYTVALSRLGNTFKLALNDSVLSTLESSATFGDGVGLLIGDHYSYYPYFFVGYVKNLYVKYRQSIY